MNGHIHFIAWSLRNPNTERRYRIILIDEYTVTGEQSGWDVHFEYEFCWHPSIAAAMRNVVRETELIELGGYVLEDGPSVWTRHDQPPQGWIPDMGDRDFDNIFVRTIADGSLLDRTAG